MEPGEPGKLAIGLDVGGTKIAGGVVTAAGEVVDREQVPTPPASAGGDATVGAILALVEVLRGRNPDVAAIGVGAAGLVETGGRIRWAPHNAYRDLPLARILRDATGLPARVDNDANAAAWAESRFGAAAGHQHVVLLTVGTGVGAGLVLGGKVYVGERGFGGELGHVTVDVDGARCECGNVGCLEAMASGTALGRYGREAAAADPGGVLARRAGGTERVTGTIVTQAARDGDPTARALLARLGFWLGVGVAAAVTTFDPAVVVIGGGLIGAGELLLAPARASFERHVFARAHRELPPIVPARLGPEAGMVGAGDLALHRRAGP
ncbi:MAG TPA: ROK family protein [Actinomycetes bacterium]|nr:ROK family protein [Actinomycetes bacterium]